MPLQATSGAASYDAFGGGAAAVPQYIEDVFSTYLYTGNGSTQTITNGIDLSGKGGLVWEKPRNQVDSHVLTDSARGVGNSLATNNTNAQAVGAGVSAFLSTGYRWDASWSASNNIASWTFRKQPKFFDVVTLNYTSGAAVFNHSLGSVPGFVIVKVFDGYADNWWVYHRSLGNNQYLSLNLTSQAQTSTGIFSATDTTFTVKNGIFSASTIVAYLYAHDAGGFGLTGTDNVISCGSYTGNGSATGPTITLGYEPQWVLVKRTDSTSNWTLSDNMRGQPVDGATAILYPNASDAEASATTAVSPTATGFQVKTAGATYNASGGTYIYIAIRRGPMKVPTSGTSVFAPALGTSASTIPTFVTNFPVDLGFYHSRANTADWFLSSRLQGGGTLNTNTTFAEAAPDANYAFDSNTGWGKNFNSDKASSNFRRAPSFFDEVCYTASGSSIKNHNLGVAPEFIITKSRNLAQNWIVTANLGANGKQFTAINTSAATYSDNFSSYATSTTIDTSVFAFNDVGYNYVAYLFATCAGVSKVGSYTGNGSSQTINCGFTGGARFVLIKKTSGTGSWYVWDSARGIVSGNDPYLLLNSTAAEVTNTDYIDTYSAGFEISSTAPSEINENGGSFIFLAIA
jgi:hypothetical protein